MAQLNPYGREFGKSFGLSEAPTLICRVLKKNEIAVTEVGSDNTAKRFCGWFESGGSNYDRF
jgi:hypothetical protein